MRSPLIAYARRGFAASTPLIGNVEEAGRARLPLIEGRSLVSAVITSGIADKRAAWSSTLRGYRDTRLGYVVITCGLSRIAAGVLHEA